MTDDVDWDDAYANAPYIPCAAQYPPRWAEQAAAFRAHCSNASFDVAYGALPRERFDLFHPEGAPKGVVVFVHGGFWKAFDKSSWSHLAQGAVEAGWTVATPSYVLAPEARLHEITQQIARAIETVGRLSAGPIRLCGHSAGGHLVARMVCGDITLPSKVASRIDRVLSISGLHDLRPLRKTQMNETLRIDADEAQAESPILRQPRTDVAVTAWVGGDERPEFIRQTEILSDAWANASAHIETGKHHFDVIDGLASVDSPLLTRLLG